MMAETGCRSVMIGRGALGRPWVFSEAFAALDPAGQRAYRFAVIVRHRELIQAYFPERTALVQLKRHLAWYTEGLRHAGSCRVRIFQARTPAEVWDIFDEHWRRASGQAVGDGEARPRRERPGRGLTRSPANPRRPGPQRDEARDPDQPGPGQRSDPGSRPPGGPSGRSRARLSSRARASGGQASTWRST